MLALSDVQILTGLGILTSGFISLEGGLSAYDWQIIIYLAWFSNVTHQACLLFLRDYLQTHPWERNCRLVLMSALAIMLMVGLIPTIFSNWDSWQSSAASEYAPALCFFDLGLAMKLYFEDPYREGPLQQTVAFQDMVASLLVLIFSFITRLWRILPTLSRFTRNRVRPKIARITRRTFTFFLKQPLLLHMFGRPLWSLLIFKPVVAIYLCGRLLMDICESSYLDVRYLMMAVSIIT